MDEKRRTLVRTGLVVLGVLLCVVSYPLEFEAKDLVVLGYNTHTYATPWTYGAKALGNETSHWYFDGCDDDSCSQSAMLMAAFSGPIQVMGLLLVLAAAFVPAGFLSLPARRGMALGGAVAAAGGFALLNGGISRLFDSFLEPAVGLYVQLAGVLCLLAPYVLWLLVRIRNSFPADDEPSQGDASPPSKSPAANAKPSPAGGAEAAETGPATAPAKPKAARKKKLAKKQP